MSKEKPKSKTIKRKGPVIKVGQPRQRAVAKELSENGGAVSVAMRKVGYSKEYSKNPHKLTKTKTWADLMEEFIPDSLLANKHKQLINKRDKYGEPDTNAVRSGLDMAYKLKKRYENPEQVHIIRKYEEMSDEDLDKRIEELENERK